MSLIVLADTQLIFPRIPSAKNYRPRLAPRKIRQKLSDGGVRIQTVQDMFNFNIKFKHITTSFRDNLKTVHDSNDAFNFIPFGTTTAWDSIIKEVVWENDFEFFTFSDNSVDSGFSGSIKLSETPI